MESIAESRVVTDAIGGITFDDGIRGLAVSSEQCKRGTHPPAFFAKSSELHENKRVEFLGGARKRKRVWNSLKRKDLNIVGSDEWRVANSGMAGMTPTPAFLQVRILKRLRDNFL